MRRDGNARRARGVTIIIAGILLLFLGRMVYIQAISGREAKQTAVSSVTVPVEATRGEIRDRNGELLVTNEQVRTVSLDFLRFPSGKQPQSRNEILLSLLKLFRKYDEEWIDALPIRVTQNGTLRFKTDRENEISYLKSKAFLHLNPYATVENCFNALVDRYELQDFSLTDARDIASVYYSMHKNGFSAGTPYTFAEDVSEALVASLKERSDRYPGVDVKVEAQRSYVDSTLAPHILGIVGAISETEYEAKKDEGYTRDDVIGKNGLEYTMEQYLRGTPGEKIITTDADGNTTETYTVLPRQGDTVVLTIDKGVQKAAQNALKKLILQQQMARNVTSGAVVVMDTRNNDVLAAASYPTFDLDTYQKQASKLNADPSKPLWNRALRSTYSPGSTIKPCVAMAGLEEGVITKDTYITCTGKYRYYEDYQPGCTGVHGGQNVVYALYHSCNIFFYETARLVGIEKLNRYFTMFGLGEKTGVELTEAEGTVDSYLLRTSKGELWTPGLTIQAGIGHGDNAFTPIQLCAYVSTIANRGVRYKAHLVKTVLTSDFSKTVYLADHMVLSQANFKADNWDQVQKGMLLVGTRSYADFSDVPVDVAAKTGTTTVEKWINGYKVDTYNGLILTFAPYEDPEIAIAVVIEGAGSGGSTAPVASEIMQYYFSTKTTAEPAQEEGTLLR